LKQSIDIMLSHDWPQGIEQYGNLKQLLKFKPFFEYVLNIKYMLYIYMLNMIQHFQKVLI